MENVFIEFMNTLLIIKRFKFKIKYIRWFFEVLIVFFCIISNHIHFLIDGKKKNISLELRMIVPWFLPQHVSLEGKFESGK